MIAHRASSRITPGESGLVSRSDLPALDLAFAYFGAEQWPTGAKCNALDEPTARATASKSIELRLAGCPGLFGPFKQGEMQGVKERTAGEILDKPEAMVAEIRLDFSARRRQFLRGPAAEA